MSAPAIAGRGSHRLPNPPCRSDRPRRPARKRASTSTGLGRSASGTSFPCRDPRLCLACAPELDLGGLAWLPRHRVPTDHSSSTSAEIGVELTAIPDDYQRALADLFARADETR